MATAPEELVENIKDFSSSSSLFIKPSINSNRSHISNLVTLSAYYDQYITEEIVGDATHLTVTSPLSDNSVTVAISDQGLWNAIVHGDTTDCNENWHTYFLVPESEQELYSNPSFVEFFTTIYFLVLETRSSDGEDVSSMVNSANIWTLLSFIYILLPPSYSFERAITQEEVYQFYANLLDYLVAISANSLINTYTRDYKGTLPSEPERIVKTWVN